MKLSRLALALALAPVTIFADTTPSREDAIKLPNTLITASRMVEERSESYAASTVFTRADIERLRPINVPHLLSQVPGVQVANYGGRGANYSLFVRGTNTAQTLVLIDGVRVGSASAGGAPLQFLNVDQIERIEVLKGSRSAVYGADAIGGVIQIFTRRGENQGLNPYVRLAAGNHSTFERTLGLSGGNGKTRFNLSVGLEETAGIDRTRESYPLDNDRDAYRNRSVALSLSHRFTDSLEAGMTVLDQRGKSEYDSTFANSLPYNNYVFSTSTAWLDARINDVWQSRLELGHAEDKLKDSDKTSPLSYATNTYRDSLNWLNTLTLGNGHSILLGLDYLKDKVHSTNLYAVNSRYNKAAFAQYSYQGTSFGGELGVRHDNNEQFGSENTYNAAVSYLINPDNQLIASYAEGFKAPTFNDLYWPNDGWFKGNPDLKPEKSKSYELQWRSQLSPTTQLEASLYRTDLRDLIVSTNTTYNVDRARINGFEAALKQELFGWQGELGISLIDPRDRKTGRTLQNRARRTLSLDMDRQLDSIGIGATFTAVSSSYANPANTERLAGYGVLDLRASWQATSDLALDIKLANVLDKDYSRLSYSYNGQFYGYQEMPFTAMLGLTWTPRL